MKQLVTLLLALLGTLLAPAAQSQTPTSGAAWTGGGAGRTQATALAADGSNNVYMAGSFAGTNVAFTTTLSLSSSPAATPNAYVAKYGPTGTVLWAQQGSGSTSTFAGLATDAAGNVYGTGYFTGTTLTLGGSTLTPASTSQQGFVVKLDASGNVQWLRLLKAPTATAFTLPTAVAVTAAGLVYVAGYFRGQLTADALPTLSATGGSADADAFLVKYDAAGTAQWAQKSGGSNEDYATGVAVDAGGNPAIAGYFNSPTLAAGTFTLTNYDPQAPTIDYSSDVFVVKYSAAGVAQWARQAGGAGPGDAANTLTADSNGNFYLVGLLDAAGGTVAGTTVPANSAGYYASFVAGYSGTGANLWGRTVADNATVNLFNIARDAGNNLLVTGSLTGSTTFAGNTFTAVSGRDMLMLRFQASGTPLDATREGGYGDDYATAATATSTGSPVLAGSTDSPYFSIGSTSLAPSGASSTGDAVLVRYSANGSGTVDFARLLSSYGGRDFVNGLGVDAQGNSYVAGIFANNCTLGTASLTATAGSGSNGFVAKYGPTGTTLWAQGLSSFGSNSSPYGINVVGAALDAAGNLYVTGTFAGSLATGGNPLAGTGTGQNVFLLKYSPSGTLLWAQAASASGLPPVAGIAVTGIAVNASGTVALSGKFEGSAATFGTTTVTGGSGAYGYAAVYSATGTLQWAKAVVAGSSNSVGGSGYLEVQQVALDAAGNVGLTGSYNGSTTVGGTVLNSTAGSAFVLRLTAAGTTAWAKAIGPGTTTAVYGAVPAFDAAGNLAVLGSYGAGPLTVGSTTLAAPAVSGNLNLVLAKYDAAGNVLWAVQSTRQATLYPQALLADASGNFYVAGSYSSGYYSQGLGLGTLTLPATYYYRGFVARYSAAGVAQWAVSPTGSGEWGIRALALGPNGSLSAAGYYTNRLTFKTGLAVQAAEPVGFDFFVARLDGATPLATDVPVAATHLPLYPNPAHDRATVPVGAGTTAVRVLDGLGREVRRQAVAARATEAVLDVAGLPAGFYLVQTVGAGPAATHRLQME